MTVVVDVQGVSARYPQSGADSPLSDASVHASAAEILTILGPNGAGKSTLLRVIAGTLSAERGTVRLFGKDQASMTRRELARSVAFVPQLGEVAFGFSVLEVVLMGRAPHQGTWMAKADVDLRIAREALARCDLEGLQNRPVAQLSGGEQKRVGIARALAQEPKLLLLDEPGAFLDVRHQIALYDLLVDLAKSARMAVVCVMHDLNVAAQYSSRVVLMKGGHVLAEGTVDQVMTHRKLRETFDADLYCGVNDLTGVRFFLPMRKAAP